MGKNAHSGCIKMKAEPIESQMQDCPVRTSIKLIQTGSIMDGFKAIGWGL